MPVSEVRSPPEMPSEDSRGEGPPAEYDREGESRDDLEPVGGLNAEL